MFSGYAPKICSVAVLKKTYGLKGDLPQIAKDLLEKTKLGVCEDWEVDPVTGEDLPSVTHVAKFWRKYNNESIPFLRRKPPTLDRMYAFTIQGSPFARELLSDAYNILAPIEGYGNLKELMSELLDYTLSPEEDEEFHAGFKIIWKIQEQERAERKIAKEKAKQERLRKKMYSI